MYASVNRVIIGWYNGLSTIRHQAIVQINAGLLSIGPIGTKFSDIFYQNTKRIIQGNVPENIVAKKRRFCPGEDGLKSSTIKGLWYTTYHMHKVYFSEDSVYANKLSMKAVSKIDLSYFIGCICMWAVCSSSRRVLFNALYVKLYSYSPYNGCTLSLERVVEWPILPRLCLIPIYDDVMTWKRFSHYWSFVKLDHWTSVDSWRILHILLILARTNCWTNTRVAGDLGRHDAHVASL